LEALAVFIGLNLVFFGICWFLDSGGRGIPPETLSWGGASCPSRVSLALTPTAQRLSLRADGERLAELLIDLEEDEPARLHMIRALRFVVGSR
jgi:hypothetical protein